MMDMAVEIKRINDIPRNLQTGHKKGVTYDYVNSCYYAFSVSLEEIVSAVYPDFITMLPQQKEAFLNVLKQINPGINNNLLTENTCIVIPDTNGLK
jgi:hypothetical protein